MCDFHTPTSSQYDSSNLGLAMHHILYTGVRSDFLVAVGCLEGVGQASRKVGGETGSAIGNSIQVLLVSFGTVIPIT